MALNGINNITIVLVNEDLHPKDFINDPEITTFTQLEELYGFSYPERLTRLLKHNYFIKGSKLISIIKNKKIIASTWLHPNFDPEGDIGLMGIKNYFSCGPVFVDTNYRKLGLASRLLKHTCYSVRKSEVYPVYMGIEIDNTPAIKHSIKYGFKLKNIIIRIKNEEPIII